MFKSYLSASAIFALAAFFAGSSSASEVECHQSKEFVVAVQELDDAPGTRIAVLPAHAKCKFDEQKALFTIGSEDDSLWFEELIGKYLVLSRSTGPQGDLVVYDLTKKAPVLDVPSDDFEVYDGGILYWERVAIGTSRNCPQFSEYENDGFGAAIVENKRFNFSSAAIENFGEKRCDATQ